MSSTQPKRGPGRPRTKNPIQVPSTTTKRGPGRPRKPVSTQTQLDDSLDRPTVNLKDKLTEKELRFLEIYMSGEYTQVNALKLAGYEGYNERYLETLARKIIVKYESQAEDHRIICRALGAGEVAVINGLFNLAQGAKSEMVRLNAWSQLSKILGLTKEQLEGAGGVTLIFEGPGTPGATVGLPGAPPLPASQGEIKVVQSSKPVMITK